MVQGLLSLFDQPRYLEVGVATGATFHASECPRKVAVDPKFRFDVAEARKANPHCTYHEVPSDVYFGELADPADRFEVIYLDGLHTVEQTLRDFTSALFFLAPGGIILIDDVRPISYATSLPDRKTARQLRKALDTGEHGWMGDVYRLVFFIETFFQQISYRTVADNYGQLVTWRGRRDSVPDRKIEEVGRLPYEYVVTHKASFQLTRFADILEELRSQRSSAQA